MLQRRAGLSTIKDIRQYKTMKALRDLSDVSLHRFFDAVGWETGVASSL